MVCGGFALGGLEIVCFEADVGTPEDACVIELETVVAANFTDDVFEEVKLEHAEVGNMTPI